MSHGSLSIRCSTVLRDDEVHAAHAGIFVVPDTDTVNGRKPRRSSRNACVWTKRFKLVWLCGRP